MESLWAVIDTINGLLFSDYTVYALLATGLLFTIWSGFGQYRALTHGVGIVLGWFDDPDDEGDGAISHFQALSTALSATVGLGNIAGVAVAVALGGPGAVFWMWIIGLLGMALKMTEVTQSMLYRNLDDPSEPHGGPMFVVREGLARRGLRPLGSFIGGNFVVTLIISAITGGNMFQAWNVADVTFTYFGVPQLVTGIILCVVVGIVIIGGIKRIGSVAGKIVPAMCIIYLVAAFYVLAVNASQIPDMLRLIVFNGLPSFLGGSPAGASGAFIGGTVGYAALWGIKRALFSSEAGQGSAPIAHAAVKTREPVSEGVVAGLEPFIDTILVCTLTALVILSTGAWNRGPEAFFPADAAPEIVQVDVPDAEPDADPTWTVQAGALPNRLKEAKTVKGLAGAGWQAKEQVFLRLATDKVDEEGTGTNIVKLMGKVEDAEGDAFTVKWDTVTSPTRPTLAVDPAGAPDRGIYGDYAGASLTAYAFDRVTPGLGKWLVTLAAWLFAISTMISWSYYGEQGVVYLSGSLGDKLILPYKVVYCALIVVTTLPNFITTDAELDNITTLGLGVMLVANIPIMLIFSREAMDAYHNYFKRVKDGEIVSQRGKKKG